jgi:hypothetical protein
VISSKGGGDLAFEEVDVVMAVLYGIFIIKAVVWTYRTLSPLAQTQSFVARPAFVLAMKRVPPKNDR